MITRSQVCVFIYFCNNLEESSMLIFYFNILVRDGDTVKHYRIRQLDEGGFFIARRTTFR